MDYQKQKEQLRGQTKKMATYIFFKNGLEKIVKNKACMFEFIGCFLLGLVAASVAYTYNMRTGIVSFRYIYILLSNVILRSTTFMSVIAIGRPLHCRFFQDNLMRIGFCNKAMEAPIPIKYHRQGEKEYVTFFSRGLPVSDWETERARIESSLDRTILSIKEGKRRSEVKVQMVKGLTLQTRVEMNSAYLTGNWYEVALGRSLSVRNLTIDFRQVPHWLIAASSGAGKTVLLKNMLYQLENAGAVTFLCDFKGFVDFPEIKKKKVVKINDHEDLDGKLKVINSIIKNRLETLNESEYANAVEFNKYNQEKMQPVYVFIDEISMVLDSTGASKEEKELINDINKQLLSIARIGRAASVYLLCFTQRSDVQGSGLSGQLKGLLMGRIAGSVPDITSSLVILDDSSAAKIPNIPGRFILKTGIGPNTEFQAYVGGFKDE